MFSENKRELLVLPIQTERSLHKTLGSSQSMLGPITTEKYFRVNEELYFDPPEAVGIGTTTGNGVGTL